MARDTIRFLFVDDNGLDAEVEIPGKFMVCGVCDGRGSQVNPSIDGHGITAEEWDRDWSDDEREGYFRGDYDITCTTCGGRRVVLEVDEDKCSRQGLQKELAAYHQQCREDAEFAAISAAERRMGA